MVFQGSGEERGATPAPESMTTSSNRPNRLHNFTLPSLKWGRQRHMRCKKSINADNNVSDSASMFKDSTTKGLTLRMTKPQVDGDDDDSIDAVREKLVHDLKTAAQKMKDEILGNKEDEEEENEEREGVKTSNEEFNKAPVGARGSSKGLKIEEKKPNSSSPMRTNGAAKLPNLRSNSEKTQPRMKFSLTLTKKEIEEDFIAMTGHPPPRKPMKRPKAVQKQVDTLYPGSWLTEVTTDSYKVHEAPKKGKSIKGKGKILLSESYEEL